MPALVLLVGSGALAPGAIVAAQPPAAHDLVIAGGRVLDPESRFDAVAWVGIAGGVVRAISSRPLQGRDTIDATGLIVAPGFIDILSYNPDPVGAWNKVADGVTTALAMHGGSANPDAWYARYDRHRPPINYGASFFHAEARNRLGIGRYQRATPAQVRRLAATAERALRRGALGISISPEYLPGTSIDEMLPLMHLARRYGVPVFFHARYSDMEEPGTNLDGLNEIIGLARETGAAVHIEHLTSTGGTFSMAQSLQLLEEARRSGLDITACAYPYDFWATYLNSARFAPGWQSRFRITYADLQIAGTPERLTAGSFRRYRAAGKLAVAYAIPEEEVPLALQSPLVMIGSDAVLERGFNNHPRASGTFARTLGRYVRARQVLPLMDALAKMTILPARRLERRSEAMRRKGRLSVGADADITIFDYATIIDRATVEHPETPSAGIHYVLVNGEVVMDPRGLRRGTRPGKAIRNQAGPDPIPMARRPGAEE
jgi:dihydroorotase